MYEYLERDIKVEDLKVESHAEYAAMCYVHGFALAMSGIFADWPDIVESTPETKEFTHQVQRAFSELSVYAYQVLARAKQHESSRVPEWEKWPELFLAGGSKAGDDWYEDELKPHPCWFRTERH